MKHVLAAVLCLSIGCKAKDDKAKDSPAKASGSAVAKTSGSASGSASAAEPPAKPAGHDCDLITEAEASAVFGRPMRHQPHDPDSVGCILEGAADPMAGPSVIVELKDDADHGLFDYFVQQGGGKPVDGLGEGAAIDGANDGIVQLYVKKGTHTIQMVGQQLQPDPKFDLIAAMKATAEKIAARM